MAPWPPQDHRGQSTDRSWLTGHQLSGQLQAVALNDELDTTGGGEQVATRINLGNSNTWTRTDISGISDHRERAYRNDQLDNNARDTSSELAARTPYIVCAPSVPPRQLCAAGGYRRCCQVMAICPATGSTPQPCMDHSDDTIGWPTPRQSSDGRYRRQGCVGSIDTNAELTTAFRTALTPTLSRHRSPNGTVRHRRWQTAQSAA